MEAAGFGFAQAKDTAQDAGTAPQEHGQAGPENVFAVKFWLHQVGQEGLNQHVNGAHPEGQAGSQHVDVVQDAFLGEENLVSFSSVNLWHPPLSDLLPSRAALSQETFLGSPTGRCLEARTCQPLEFLLFLNSYDEVTGHSFTLPSVEEFVRAILING